MTFPPERRQRWILILTALTSFMTALDAMVVTTALTTIRDELGASVGTLQWTVNAYNLSFAVFLMTGADLDDRRAARQPLAATQACAEDLGCGLASSLFPRELNAP